MKLALAAAVGVVAMHAVHLVLGNRIAARALLAEQARLGARLTRLVAAQAGNLLVVNDVAGLSALVRSAASSADDVSYCFIVRDGRTVVSSFEGATPAALVAARRAGDEGAPVLLRFDGAEILDVTAPLAGGRPGYVRLGLGTRSLHALRRELGLELGELALAVIAAGLLAAFVAGRTLARPVEDMLAAVDRFDPAGAGPGPVVDTRGTDEVAVLADRINRMMRRLEAVHAEGREAREKVVKTGRLAALGTLVAGVAHEVNNPLAGLRNCLRRIERGDLPEPKRREYLALMDEGLARIEAVVRRLLDFGRPQPTRLEPVRAEELGFDALRLVRPILERRQVRTALLVIPGVDSVVVADRGQIGQGILNLLLNAAYVTPDGGEIRVRVRRQGERVGIAVEDDGPGIPPEIRDRILDPFFSTKPEGDGTGLGLAVTRTIVDAHGGELAFEFPERGTVAVIWLRHAGGRSA
jgi:two-component system NtrC family sensor kinase